MDSDRKHWVSVAAAVVDGEQVLAIRRRDNGKWEPPGGTLEPEETILEGLRREVSEEIGIIPRSPLLTGVYKNLTRNIVALVFRCEHDGQTPVVSAEASEFAWLNREQIINRLDPAYACRLIDALDLAQPKIRSHDGTNLLGE